MPSLRMRKESVSVWLLAQKAQIVSSLKIPNCKFACNLCRLLGKFLKNIEIKRK